MPLYCKKCGTRVESKAAQERHCAGGSSLAVRSSALACPVGHPAGDRVIDAVIVPQGGASLVRVRPEPLARRVDPAETKRRTVKFLLWPLHEVLFPGLFPSKPRADVAGKGSLASEGEEIIRVLTEGR